MHATELATIGWWRPGEEPPATDRQSLSAAVARVRDPLHVVRADARAPVGVAFGGGPAEAGAGAQAWLGTLPPLFPEWLGDRSFAEVHGTRFAYVVGAMANGIATTRMVRAAANAGFLGMFGAAGLSHARVVEAVDELATALGDRLPWGSNLIHSPHEPALERAVADLYVARGVRRVSASAYTALTPAIVRYAFAGVRVEAGRIVRSRHVFCKISHPDVARRFLTPPPAAILDGLVREGALTAEEAALARRLPVAEDVIVESDSGGHTDNRPLGALFPSIVAVRDAIQREHGYERPIRLGAAGGLGTPEAVAAAFALGASFVLTGSVNQACVESGLSEVGRRQLAQAGLGDVTMAPAADMFEQGVKVQVLKRGTMFAPRAHRLYEIYRSHDSLDDLSAEERTQLEQRVLGRPLDEIWDETRAFWARRDADELARAERDPHHRMALCFRWYLGLSSRWAIAGDSGRAMDYQIWCGPAMGAFNAWTRGTFLEDPARREVAQVGLNLLEGAAVATRAHQLRTFGVAVPDEAFRFVPRPLA
ncbi:MAG: PfaD family polyunsaturated fatty acid/polyketide biosynthesis protein [Alphaproteobacteria bacterium]|nr:PfaD family polyunsaturated fatty acid/polyketide biosynthesis protein [Alphaproteobacteria bacterium]